MAKIAIIAPTGMLGSAVYGVLKEHHQLVLVFRDASKLDLLDKAYGQVNQQKLVQFDIAGLQADYLQGFPQHHQVPKVQELTAAIGPVDMIVNAAGIIKPHSLKDPAMTLFVNGAFPHILASVYGSKLIQITTDCVFSGIAGAPYTEESPISPNDLYGLSKAIGEPEGQSLVLRTSIIGEELHSFVSLIEWVKKQRGQEARGFTRHLWNGITTKQFGRIVHTIASDRRAYPATGLYHVFGSDVTKYDMVTAIAKKFDIDVKIAPDHGPVLDRRLRTVKKLCAKLHIPTFHEMLDDL